MYFLDWLLGISRFGRAKSLIIPGLIGMFLMAIFAGDAYEYHGSERYFIILIGLPIYLALKNYYWKKRANAIIYRTRANHNYENDFKSILKWNPDLAEQIMYMFPDEKMTRIFREMSSK